MEKKNSKVKTGFLFGVGFITAVTLMGGISWLIRKGIKGQQEESEEEPPEQ